ncbi:hypothetical protein DYB35_010665 [Aphanomyces astaci]|uniref:PPM-type phosphatase domain-containing protein n=1 Tax=Aphanomyces astaci TaxID=112090 RepID=A0A3R6WCH8_APHAT|nr:hypothetical protein DYB35_010665 [Aphanomyces astaci]
MMLHVGATTDIGNSRQTNEDVYAVFPDLPRITSDLALHRSAIALFDGHCGVRAAAFARENFEAMLVASPAYGRDTCMALEASVRELDRVFLAMARRKHGVIDGTTLVVVVIERIGGTTRLTTANVGDSRAIMVANKVRQLTIDQNAARPDEANRVALVVASDGVWEVVSNSLVKRCVDSTLRCSGHMNHADQAHAVSAAVVALAKRQPHSTDNITAVVALLRPVRHNRTISQQIFPAHRGSSSTEAAALDRRMKDSPTAYTFDRLFPPETSTAVVYASVAKVAFVDIDNECFQDLLTTSPSPEPVRMVQGGMNKSLLAFGHIVWKLSHEAHKPTTPPQTTDLPYGDSQLTRLLQPSLGPHASLVMLCTLSPSLSGLNETHKTLKFASRAKRIHYTLRPRPDAVMDESSPHLASSDSTTYAILALRRQLASLHAQLSDTVDDDSRDSIRVALHNVHRVLLNSDEVRAKGVDMVSNDAPLTPKSSDERVGATSSSSYWNDDSMSVASAGEFFLDDSPTVHAATLEILRHKYSYHASLVVGLFMLTDLVITRIDSLRLNADDAAVLLHGLLVLERAYNNATATLSATL